MQQYWLTVQDTGIVAELECGLDVSTDVPAVQRFGPISNIHKLVNRICYQLLELNPRRQIDRTNVGL